MASIQRARQVIIAAYVVGALVALALLIADSRTGDMAGFVLIPVAGVAAGLVAIALGVGSLLGTGAMMRDKSTRAADLLLVAAGWVGASGLAIYVLTTYAMALR